LSHTPLFIAASRKQQRERQFRDTDAVGPGRIHHENAALGCSLDVHVVDARSGAGDHPKIRCCLDEGAINGGGAAHDDCVGIRDISCELLGRPLRPGVDDPARNTPEHFDSGDGKQIGDDNLHAQSIMSRFALDPRPPDAHHRGANRSIARNHALKRVPVVRFPHTFPQLLCRTRNAVMVM
jgi:hypothetical protein